MAYQGQRSGMSPQHHYQENQLGTPPSPPRHGYRPGMHPDSNFNQMQGERFGAAENPQDTQYHDPRSQSPPVMRRPLGAPLAQQHSPYRERSPSPPLHPGMPPPNAQSPFRDPYQGQSDSQNHQDPYASQQRANNYGPPLAGAAALGAAIPLVDRQLSPVVSPIGNMGSYAHLASPSQQPSLEQMDQGFSDSPYRYMNPHESYGSEARLAVDTPPVSTPTYPEPMYNSYSDRSPSPNRLNTPYSDGPLVPQSRSHNEVNNLAYVDPNAIIDDGDDGFGMYNVKRNSRVNLPFNKSKASVNAAPLAAGAGAGAGAGVLSARALGDNSSAGSARGGEYTPVSAVGVTDPALEKSVWLKDTRPKGRRWKKTVFILAGLLIVLAIAAGAVGGILGSRKSNSEAATSTGQSAADDGASNGDLSKDSAEVKKLMNNANLHKVFSGFAYTPINTQYPACLTNPPSQNNVTRDIAVMSQLTNVLRLYGTDCNQTEMVLHAIDRLQLTDMKVWLGVWLGDNSTTNSRQVSQMWKILEKNKDKYLKGVAIGNEVLFRKDLTATQLASYLTQTKSNLTAMGLNLPVATSDLGDNWTANLATNVDVIMSNIHPFFGGVTIDQAAGWTYDFWKSHDVAVTAGMNGKSHIISEIGWPSDGGNDCGNGDKCPDATSGAVANIPNMNRLMNDWVCQALANGTDYFWFEAFDEPWKIAYNTPSKGQNWEDKWGLMDINRNLKKGLVIPSCGGTTVKAA